MSDSISSESVKRKICNFNKRFHTKNRLMHTYVINIPLISSVTPTCLGPQWAIFRKYDWYIFIARSTKCAPDVKFSLLSTACITPYNITHAAQAAA